MVKLGLMHAVLLDWALGEKERRKPRITDAFIQSLAPFDTGLFLLRMMNHIGMLDDVQRDWLRQAERAEDDAL